MRSTISFIVGIVGWVSSIFTAASVALVIPQTAIGMLILVNPEMTSKPWMVFIGFQATNLAIFGFNCFNRILPLISKLVLGMSLCTIVIFFVSILAAASSYQPASFVFATLINESGWSHPGIALLTGMVGVNWGFSCLDAVTHLAEEIPNPRKNVPKALIGTVCVGMITAFPISIAILFCLQDVTSIISTPTLVPSVELFNQVFRGNHSAVIGLQSLLLISTVGSFWGYIHGNRDWPGRLRATTVSRCPNGSVTSLHLHMMFHSMPTPGPPSGLACSDACTWDPRLPSTPLSGELSFCNI